MENYVDGIFKITYDKKKSIQKTKINSNVFVFCSWLKVNLVCLTILFPYCHTCDLLGIGE